MPYDWTQGLSTQQINEAKQQTNLWPDQSGDDYPKYQAPIGHTLSVGQDTGYWGSPTNVYSWQPNPEYQGLSEQEQGAASRSLNRALQRPSSKSRITDLVREYAMKNVRSQVPTMIADNPDKYSDQYDWDTGELVGREGEGRIMAIQDIENYIAGMNKYGQPITAEMKAQYLEETGEPLNTFDDQVTEANQKAMTTYNQWRKAIGQKMMGFDTSSAGTDNRNTMASTNPMAQDLSRFNQSMGRSE